MDKAIIIDLDGTLVNNWIPLSGSKELIDYFNSNKIPFYIVTNRVSKTIEQIGENLRLLNFCISNNQIINPIVALDKYIKKHNIKTYFFVGPDYQKNKLIKSDYFDKNPEFVILCDFENINCDYLLFNKIYQYIQNGAKIIATSYSNYYYSDNEYKMDTGIFVKMYEILTENKAIIIGKPSTEILKIAVNELKKDPKDIIIIGDDGKSDIEGGQQLGMKTILVKTGIYNEGNEEKFKPNIAINSLKEIEKIIKL